MSEIIDISNLDVNTVSMTELLDIIIANGKARKEAGIAIVDDEHSLEFKAALIEEGNKRIREEKIIQSALRESLAEYRASKAAQGDLNDS
jgi:hypothetical protein